MKKIIKDIKLATSVTSIFMIVLGILLLLRPTAALVGVCRLVGSLLLIIGLILLISFAVQLKGNNGGSPAAFLCVMGTILAAIGIFIIIRPQAVLDFVGIWFAALLLLHGMNGVREMLNLKKLNDQKWYLMLINITFNILVAVLILLHPFGSAAFVLQIAGIGLLVSGIMGLGTNARVIHVGYTFKKKAESGKDTIIDVEPDELRSVDDKKKKL